MRVDGFELARIQIGIGNLDPELALQLAHQIGQRERIEEPGSNSDSSGSGSAVLFETFRTIARMRSLIVHLYWL